MTTFSVTGLPTGLTASFAPPTLAQTGQTILTLTAASDTVTGDYPLTVTATSGSTVTTADLTATVASTLAPFALQPDSPAVDAGTATGAPTTDIEDTARDATPDIGAYEKH